MRKEIERLKRYDFLDKYQYINGKWYYSVNAGIQSYNHGILRKYYTNGNFNKWR